MCDLEYQGEINTDGKISVPVNDLKAQFHFTEVGLELDNFPDAMETELANRDMFEMSCLFCAEECFIDENGWPESSQKYLINEHNY